MKAAGYTYGEIANALGISRSYAHKLVKGKDRQQTPSNPGNDTHRPLSLEQLVEQLKRERGGDILFPP